MTYSRSVAVLCFIVVMLITALTPLAWNHPPRRRGRRMTETVATPRVPPQGGTARAEETLMRMRYAALAARSCWLAALAATLLLTSNAAPQPTSAGSRPRQTRRCARAEPSGSRNRRIRGYKGAPTSTVTIPPVDPPARDRNGTGRRSLTVTARWPPTTLRAAVAAKFLAGTATLTGVPRGDHGLDRTVTVNLGARIPRPRTRVTHLNLRQS